MKINEFAYIFYHYFRYNIITKKFKFNIYRDNETIDNIVLNKKSICRFGDGEYGMLWGNSIGFQDYNEDLSDRLKEILNSQRDDVLVCIPEMLKTTKGQTLHAKTYNRCFVSTYFNGIFKYTPNDNRYFGNMGFTRFYMDFKDKRRKTVDKKIQKLKSIWDKKDVYIIEGLFSRNGVGNDIFDNVNSIKRITCPSTNAFNKYDSILKTATENIPNKDNTIILIMLEPTATVLAYDLSELGYQAIDMGHMDIEYEWYRVGAKKKSKVSGKAVNERNSNNPDNPITNDEYVKEIICSVD